MLLIDNLCRFSYNFIYGIIYVDFSVSIVVIVIVSMFARIKESVILKEPK
jgi:hypothetical protein